MAILSNWHTRQLDFVLAFTQADIERDLYMKLPADFTVPGRRITEQDQEWDTSSHMQDVPCIGHLKCKLR